MGSDGEGPSDGAATHVEGAQDREDRLDRALTVLASPDEYEPGAHTHYEASVDLAQLVTDNPGTVGEQVTIVVEAFERTLDDERSQPTPRDTAESHKRRIAASRESMVDALTAVSGNERARTVLVPTVQRWLADGNETLLRAGLVVGWALLDDGVSPAVHAAFAKALEPVLDGEHPGYQRVSESVSQDPVQVNVPSESLPVRIPVSPERVSDSELVTELWRFTRHLSAAAAEALETCDEDAVEHALTCQDHLHGGNSAVLKNATTVLEAVDERDLYDCRPLVVANLAATVLAAYDDPSTEPYVSYDEDGALWRALDTFVNVERRSSDPIVPPFDRIASVAEEHPGLMSRYVEALMALSPATYRQGQLEELLDAFAAVAETAPQSVAEYVDLIAPALGPNCDTNIAESVAGIFADVAAEHPGAVEPQVDNLVKAFEAMEDDSGVLDGVTVGSFFLHAASVMAHLAPAYPATVLDHEPAVLEALRRANTDLLVDDQIERLRQLLGAAVDDAIEGNPSPERLVDGIEADADTGADASVEECIATLSAALEAETDDTDGDADAAADDSKGDTVVPGADDGDPTPRVAMERLTELHTDRPRAVEPNLSTLLEAVERFEEPELVVPALAVLSRLADANSRTLAGRLEPVVEALVETDRTNIRINTLLTLRNTADEAPEAVAPHVEHVPEVIEATDDGDATLFALEVLYNVSQECQAAVAPHLDPVAERVTPNDDRVSLITCLTLHFVALDEPEAVADHADVLLDLIDETDPGETTGSAVETLGQVAEEHPDVVLSEFDLFASALASADDWRVVRALARTMYVATTDGIEPALNHVDLLAETLEDYVGYPDDPERGTNADGDSEGGLNWFLLGTLGLLDRIGREDPTRLEPHVPVIVAALQACTDPVSAWRGCRSLAWVSEVDPNAVRPHFDSVTEVAIRFADPDVQHAYFTIHNNLGLWTGDADDFQELYSQTPEYFDDLDETLSENEATATNILQYLNSFIRDNDIQELVAAGMFTEMVLAYAEMIDEYPDATAEIDAGQHVETMVRVARTVDDPEIVETAAKAVHLLALHRPAAAATRADAVLDLLDGADPPHENELVVLYLLTALANILREDATAIADRAEVVAASVDPPSAVTDAILERGIDVLSRGAGRPARPAALVPHIELLIEALSHTDDADAVDDALRALLIITAAEDEPKVRPHADEIGTSVGRLDDWQTPIEGLDDAQQRYPELKLAVADVLAAALAERETVEPEQAEPVRTALVRIADGIEPPMATARITDILARVGSTVPPPHVADDVEPDEGGNHGDDTEQCGK